jgi:phage-related protein
MDLRSIVTYLSAKDMNARKIYADMNDTLGADCIGYSNVRKYLRESNFSKSMLDMDFEPKIEEENFIDEAILETLEEYHFASLLHATKRIFIPMRSVRYHLVNSWGYRIRNI